MPPLQIEVFARLLNASIPPCKFCPWIFFSFNTVFKSKLYNVIPFFFGEKFQSSRNTVHSLSSHNNCLNAQFFFIFIFKMRLSLFLLSLLHTPKFKILKLDIYHPNIKLIVYLFLTVELLKLLNDYK